MITSYEVGAVFTVQDRATPIMQRLATEARELGTLIKQVSAELTELGKGVRLGGLTSRIAALNKEMMNLSRSSADVGASIAGSFSAMNAEIMDAAAGMRVLVAEMAAAAREARTIRMSGVGVGGGGGRGVAATAGGRGRGGHGGGIHARVRAPHTGAVHFGGDNAALAGIAILGYGVEQASELAHVQARMRIGGVSEADIQEATSLSRSVADRYGQKQYEVLETINEIRNPLGGVREAMEHIPSLGAAMQVLGAVDKTGNLKDQVYDLVKSAEFRNAIGPDSFDHAIDMMVRAAVATGGRVNPAEFVQFSKYARGALTGLSDRFLYSYGPELAQEFKGSSAGTVLASLNASVVGGQLTTRSARLLDSIGLIDRDKVEYDKHGRILKTKPGAVIGSAEFSKDPDVFAARVLDAMKSHGMTTAEQQRPFLTQAFGNRNAQQFLMTLMYQIGRLDRGAAGIAQTLDTKKAADVLTQTDPMTNWTAFIHELGNVGSDLGSVILPDLVKGMRDSREQVKAFSDWVGGIRNKLVDWGILSAPEKPPAPPEYPRVPMADNPLGTGIRGEAARRRQLFSPRGFAPIVEPPSTIAGLEFGLSVKPGGAVKQLPGAIPTLPGGYPIQKTENTITNNQTNNITVKNDLDGSLDALARRLLGLMTGMLHLGSSLNQGGGSGIADSPYTAGTVPGG